MSGPAPGWPLEPVGNVRPRWMAAVRLGEYRTRLTGRLAFCPGRTPGPIQSPVTERPWTSNANTSLSILPEYGDLCITSSFRRKPESRGAWWCPDACDQALLTLTPTLSLRELTGVGISVSPHPSFPRKRESKGGVVASKYASSGYLPLSAMRERGFAKVSIRESVRKRLLIADSGVRATTGSRA